MKAADLKEKVRKALCQFSRLDQTPVHQMLDAIMTTGGVEALVGTLAEREKYIDQLHAAINEHIATTENVIRERIGAEARTAELTATLEDAHSALVATVAAMKRAPSMQGREYDGLGIQINDAISLCCQALAPKTRPLIAVTSDEATALWEMEQRALPEDKDHG